MKKIAIDLDGVVFDSENLFRVYAEIYDVDVLKTNSMVDNSERTFQKRYSWPNEIYKEFYSKYASEVIKNANVMSGADIVLKKLSKDYEMIVVTSRSDVEVDVAKQFFETIGLNIKIFNNQISKIDVLKNENVDYIIDDDDNICINASNSGICALHFRNAASKFLEENNNLKVVNNWGEVYRFFNGEIDK